VTEYVPGGSIYLETPLVNALQLTTTPSVPTTCDPSILQYTAHKQSSPLPSSPAFNVLDNDGTSGSDSETGDDLDADPDYVDDEEDQTCSPSIRHVRPGNSQVDAKGKKTRNISSTLVSRSRRTQRHGYSPYGSSSSSSPASSSSRTLLSSPASSSSLEPESPSSFRPQHTAARLKQVPYTGTIPSPVQISDDVFKCPICDQKPTKGRDQEVKRHIKAHFSEGMKNKPMCLGVRLEDAEEYGADTEIVQEHDGEMWVGGCGKTFSRRDAYLRHVHNQRCPSYAVATK
jgi:uncharacterized C2H2 Zn-finger protein